MTGYLDKFSAWFDGTSLGRGFKRLLKATVAFVLAGLITLFTNEPNYMWLAPVFLGLEKWFKSSYYNS